MTEISLIVTLNNQFNNNTAISAESVCVLGGGGGGANIISLLYVSSTLLTTIQRDPESLKDCRALDFKNGILVASIMQQRPINSLNVRDGW